MGESTMRMSCYAMTYRAANGQRVTQHLLAAMPPHARHLTWRHA